MEESVASNDSSKSCAMKSCSMKSCGANYTNIGWWATLVVAVLAVPSLAIIVSAMTGTRGFFEVSIFIVACWACTWLGMQLMKNPKIVDSLDLKKKP